MIIFALPRRIDRSGRAFLIMRKLLLLILAASFGVARAQTADSMAVTAPDYKQIAAEVADIASPYYYPKLMARYEKGDTTLTLDDFRHLYYGYPDQPDYKPLLTSPYADSLERAFGKKTRLEAQDFRRAVGFAREILKEEPFSMRDMNALAFAYQMLDEPEKAAAQMFKIKGVLEAIRSTGTGLKEESPWYVIYMRDAEDVLNLIGAKFTKFIILTRSVEYAPVYNMENKRDKGYYFDYSEVYKRRPDYLDELPKQKRKFEVNPLYNPRSKQNILPR